MEVEVYRAGGNHERMFKGTSATRRGASRVTRDQDNVMTVRGASGGRFGASIVSSLPDSHHTDARLGYLISIYAASGSSISFKRRQAGA